MIVIRVAVVIVVGCLSLIVFESWLTKLFQGFGGLLQDFDQEMMKIYELMQHF